MTSTVDAVVIGAGFGGLGAAIGLAERGMRVRLYEALSYPGGCASTFTRQGVRFEAGATLSSGLDDDALFGRWIHRYGLPVRRQWTDPTMTMRSADLTVPVWRDRARFRASMAALPGAPVDGLASFFAEQDRVASPLWRLFAEDHLLPPFSAAALVDHVRHLPDYLPLAGVFGRTLGDVLRRHRVDGFAPLRQLYDYLCQITVQCSADDADALFALPATDYPWRGTGHVHDGIGRLAEALVDAARGLGVDVRLADRVQEVAKDGPGFRLTCRSGEVRARAVVANLLPVDAARLVGAPIPTHLQDPIDAGWGAAMLYRVVEDDPSLPRDAAHWMCVGDPARPLCDGNHTFVSLSGVDEDRGAGGRRTVTASTHVRLADVRADPGPRIAPVQARMREVLALRAPELTPSVEWPGSPRTFARFTRRSSGAVGGAARVLRWRAWVDVGPQRVAPRVWLVGDSVFPGQSTLATAVGGVRVAEAVRRALGPGSPG